MGHQTTLHQTMILLYNNHLGTISCPHVHMHNTHTAPLKCRICLLSSQCHLQSCYRHKKPGEICQWEKANQLSICKPPLPAGFLQRCQILPSLQCETPHRALPLTTWRVASGCGWAASSPPATRLCRHFQPADSAHLSDGPSWTSSVREHSLPN